MVGSEKLSGSETVVRLGMDISDNGIAGSGQAEAMRSPVYDSDLDMAGQEELVPNQYQAWCVVVGMASTLGIMFGTTVNSFGVFAVPLSQAFSASNQQVASISSFFMLSMTLSMPIGGWLLDRIGPRLVMVSGGMLASGGHFLGAHSQEIHSLAMWIMISGAGIGISTYVPAIALVLRWVKLSRQALALGLVLSGSSLGAMFFPLLLTTIIAEYQWSYAMNVIGALMLIIVVPILLCLARWPPQLRETAGGQDLQLLGKPLFYALRLSGYWFWVGMLTLLTFSMLGIIINIVPYLIRSGYTPAQAAGVFSAASTFALLGHGVFGFFSARWDARDILWVANVVGIIGILALLSVSFSARMGYVALGVFVLAWGATFNLVNQFSPMLMAKMVGERHFGTLLGIGSLIAGLGSAFSPMLVGYLVDANQSYTAALLLCVACMMLAMRMIRLLPGRAAK